MRGGAGLLALLAALAFVPHPAAAQVPLFDRDGVEATLGGYLRWLGAGHDLGYDGAGPRRTAFQAGVARLRWNARGSGWLLELHDRVDARWSSEPLGPSLLGFGVSAVPDRVDLESVLARGERYQATHDVDRLAVTAYTPVADVTVGRQAITWGLATLFPVADLWSRFSPYELDTEEKPGIDAVRALAYPGQGMELDLVAADRGAARDFSAGARLSASLGSVDAYLAAGKLWREIMGMGGVAVLLNEVKLRGEAVVPRDLDGEGWLRPRVTVGADWIRGGWSLTGEVHYNGIGASQAGGYAAVLLGPRVARGETYFLGRWYAGAAGTYSVTDRVTLAASLLANLQDPSASLTPSVTWDVGQRGRLSGGALLTAGAKPNTMAASPLLPLRSEFGAYGNLLFVQAGWYF